MEYQNLRAVTGKSRAEVAKAETVLAELQGAKENDGSEVKKTVERKGGVLLPGTGQEEPGGEFVEGEAEVVQLIVAEQDLVGVGDLAEEGALPCDSASKLACRQPQIMTTPRCTRWW